MIKKKPAAAPAAKKAVKPAVKSGVKPAVKPAMKPAVKPAMKPAVKPAAAVVRNTVKAPKKAAPPGPVAVKPAKSLVKTPAATDKPVAAKAPAASSAGSKSSAPLRANGADQRSLLDTKDRPRKAKLVRDSFTMPEEEYAALAEVKKACLKAGYEVKKSELLRVGVGLIRKMDIVALKDILAGLPPLKAGRPKKS